MFPHVLHDTLPGVCHDLDVAARHLTLRLPQSHSGFEDGARVSSFMPGAHALLDPSGEMLPGFSSLDGVPAAALGVDRSLCVLPG